MSSFWKYKRFDISHKSTSCPHDHLLRFQSHILQYQFIYSFTQLDLSSKGNQMCFPRCPSPMESCKGFIALALKAWMVETTLSISLFNLHEDFPSAESVSQNEADFWAPQKNF